MVRFFKVIRWALTIFLLIIAWQNSHWSVALALSLISFSIEGLAAAIGVHSRILQANVQLYRDIIKDHEHTGS